MVSKIGAKVHLFLKPAKNNRKKTDFFRELLLKRQKHTERGALAQRRLDHHVAAILTCEVLAELQSESRAFLSSSAVGSLSLVEDAVETLWSDTDAMVCDTNLSKVALDMHGNLYRGILWAELDGIRQEVAYDGLEHIVVGAYHYRCICALILQRNLLRGGYHLENFHHSGDDVVEVEVLEHNVKSAGLTLSPLQQVVEQVVTLLRLAVGLVEQVEEFRSDDLRRHCRDHKIEHHTDGSHRRPQIMGDDRIHLITVGDGGAQLFVLPLNEPFGRNETDLMHHAHQQFVLIEGLGEKVAGTDLESLNEVVGAVESRKEDDRNLARRRVFLQDHGGIESADVGHHHIEEDQVGLLRLGHLDAHITTVGRAHLELLIRQQNLKQQDIAHHIVYNENLIIAAVDILFQCPSKIHSDT